MLCRPPQSKPGADVPTPANLPNNGHYDKKTQLRHAPSVSFENRAAQQSPRPTNFMQKHGDWYDARMQFQISEFCEMSMIGYIVMYLMLSHAHPAVSSFKDFIIQATKFVHTWFYRENLSERGVLFLYRG